ncbi:MAG: recombinase family protein, partial [Syntrophorhabdales bacterium]
MKIQHNHLEKPAYVYIRQSSMAQVRHHQESTERQYALEAKARELGWKEVLVLDGDLGISGAQMAGRNDFKTLVTDVSMRKAGAVFALEASRLARNSTDWHRLLELCAFTDTLIIDEDGCYNPADFNDQLLLGLKGTMSQAELHFLRGRLLGGKINKAKKGELRSPLPVGFVYDEEGRTVIDPDAEVRHAVTMVFARFRETGSAYGVIHAFGGGVALFEVQQNSDATFRLCDWGCVGADGKPRALHPDEAVRAVGGRALSLRRLRPRRLRGLPFDAQRLLACDRFVMDRWRVRRRCVRSK